MNNININNQKKGRQNIRPITEAQSKVLLFIDSYIDERRYPPSYRDISDGMKFASTNAVSNHMVALETKGYIKSERGRARAIWLTDKAVDFVKLCKKGTKKN
jgi:repressor LexA